MSTAPLHDRLAGIAGWIEQGQFEPACSALHTLIHTHPASAAAWKMLGVVENKLGSAQDAENSLRMSLQLDASDSDTWSSLGGVYVALGRYGDAMKAFEQGLTRDPGDTYALLNALSMAALVTDFDSARRHHAAALDDGQRRCEAQAAAAANLPWCWYDLAQIHFLRGETVNFGSALQQAIAMSRPWQLASARKTYELLARSAVLMSKAALALADFARLEQDQTQPGG